MFYMSLDDNGLEDRNKWLNERWQRDYKCFFLINFYLCYYKISW